MIKSSEFQIIINILKIKIFKEDKTEKCHHHPNVIFHQIAKSELKFTSKNKVGNIICSLAF